MGLSPLHSHTPAQARFVEATAEKAKVEAEAAACVERLGLAERLVNGLSAENARWGEEVQRLKVRKKRQAGRASLIRPLTHSHSIHPGQRHDAGGRLHARRRLRLLPRRL